MQRAVLPPLSLLVKGQGNSCPPPPPPPRSGTTECTTNALRIYFEFFSITNQPECFEHVQNIRDGLPNQPECSTNVTNAFRISRNALRIMIRTTFELIWAQCDWGIKLEQNLHVNFGKDSVCIVRSCIGSAGFENLISKNHPVKDNRTSIKFTPSFQGCRNPGGDISTT